MLKGPRGSEPPKEALIHWRNSCVSRAQQPGNQTVIKSSSSRLRRAATSCLANGRRPGSGCRTPRSGTTSKRSSKPILPARATAHSTSSRIAADLSAVMLRHLFGDANALASLRAGSQIHGQEHHRSHDRAGRPAAVQALRAARSRYVRAAVAEAEACIAQSKARAMASVDDIAAQMASASSPG